MNFISQAVATAAIVGLVTSIASGLFSDANAATENKQQSKKIVVPPSAGGNQCQLGIKFVPSAYLNGYNEKKLTKQTITSCLQACDSEPWCKSIDVDAANGVCYLAKVTRHDVASGLSREPSTSFDYYEQCPRK